MTDAKPTRIKPGPKPGRKPKRSKYNAKGEHIDGHWFASQSEAVRYRQLRDMAANGYIEDLELQPSFRVSINNQLICTYRADFGYRVVDTQGETIASYIEDVKGMITPVYTMKRKMVVAQYNIEIVEVPAKSVDKWEGCVPSKRANEKDWQPLPVEKL